LEVKSDYVIDKKPIFYSEGDPFIIRFKVRPLIWLPLEKAIPIRDDMVWKQLSFTKKYDKTRQYWSGKLRHSPTRLTDDDGKLLETLLQKQLKDGKTFEIEAYRIIRHTKSWFGPGIYRHSTSRRRR